MSLSAPMGGSRRLSTASLAFHSGNKHRFSRSGSVLRPTIGAATAESVYAKQAYTGQPVSMINELSRLEELKKIQQDMDHEQTIDERRNGFIQATIIEAHDHKATSLMDIRLILFDIVENKKFDHFMMTIIVVNSFCLVLNQWSVDSKLQYAFIVNILEPIFLSLYIWEAAIKIIVYKSKYFKKKWNLLDFTIVMFASIDFVVNVVLPIMSAGEQANSQFQSQYFKISRITRSLKMTRTFRSVRMFRLIRVFESLQDLLKTILRAMQALMGVLIMLIIFIILFVLVGFQMFGHIKGSRYFNTFMATATTLIQVLTLDDWFEIVIDMSQYGEERKTFWFLLIYQIVTYFICLNLFIAVLVDNFQLTLGKKACKAKFKEEVQEEENALVDRVEGDLAEISDVDLRARLVNLNEVLGDKKDEESDDYETSDSDEDPEEVNERVLSGVRAAHPQCDADELNTTYWYFRLTATLEKHLHTIRDQMATHDRIIDLIVDDQDELHFGN